MSTVVYRRRPRQHPPALPRGEVLLESPPEVTETVSGGGATAALTYLPMLAGGGAMAFMFVRPGSGALGAVIGVLYAVSMAGMLVGQLGRGSNEKKRRLDGERRDYARYLTQVRRQVRRAAQQQHEALAWRGPEPGALWSVAMSSRLWERRPGDEDFGHARIGLGTQQLAVRLVTPQTKPVEDLEPVSAGALRRFVRTHSTIDGLPVSVSLPAFGRVLLDGPPDAVRPLVRAVLAQLATFHGPDDLTVAVCASPDRLDAWDWVKWLPHALHPSRTDAAGPVRLVTATAAGLEELLPDLRRRGRFTGPGAAPSAVPHVVVVLDGATLPADSAFAASDVDGVTLLDLGATHQVDDRPGVLRLEVRTDAVHQVTRDRAGTVRRAPLGRPDALSSAEAEALARLMAPLRTAVGGDPDADATTRDLGLLQLLGLGDARRVDPAATWRPRPERERLRVPIGVGPTGVPVELDIKEAAQGGMGPHGLVVGATGSGKSELLRSLVLGLAVTHSCETLNFVLVDFKGGATFARLEDLPHTSAVITNLADDLALVDRMKDAIDGELNRRQELLRDAGNYANVKDYERAREGGAPLDPLPSLFVVVDEFSELLSAKPDFIDLFIMIGRIGRSLGVHLLLASQRLEEGRLRGLDTYLSYRIGLRTFSALESRVVLGVPDAHELPSAPGHGYLKTDPTVPMQRFRSAYVSGPYTGPRTASGAAPAPASEVLEYSVHHAAPATAPVAPVPAARTPEPDAPTVLDVVVDRLVGHGAPARQVWLPPLTEPPTLDALLPPLVPGEHGLAPAGQAGRGGLRVPVGLVDRPYHQRRDPFWLDLSGAGGHVAVVGGPQSGKSTVLRDLVAGLALTHTPRQVQLYCLDLGGGALAGLRDLPHVGSVAGRLAPDLVRRTLAEVEGVLLRREKIFEALGVDSMASYRRLREQEAAGPAAPEPLLEEDPHGDVFLVVDGWGALRTDFEPLEAQITAIAARGLTYGVHVVVAATRWMEVRPALRDLLGTRVELRLGDPTESEVDRRLATNVPQSAPGRGLTPDRLHFLSALPRIDGTPDVPGLADGVADLVARVRAAWPGAGAPAVRMLPSLLPYPDLAAHVRSAGAVDRTRPVLGIDEADLAPVHLELAAEPHLVVLGDTRSGKTNVLRVLVEQVTAGYSPDEAKVVLLDYRHTLLDVADRPHVLAHGFSSAHAAPIVAQVVTGLTKRLPPQDITPDRLAARDWWHGPELFVVVDDYDLVAGGAGTPLLPLLDLLPLARDIGLHVVLARASGGAGRAMFEPVVQRLREAGSPALLLSGSRDEGPLFGNVRPEPLPPGRGRLVTRRGARLVQTAYLPAG